MEENQESIVLQLSRHYRVFKNRNSLIVLIYAKKFGEKIPENKNALWIQQVVGRILR